MEGENLVIDFNPKKKVVDNKAAIKESLDKIMKQSFTTKSK